MPILLPDVLDRAIKFLRNTKRRQLADIPVYNHYLFGTRGKIAIFLFAYNNTLNVKTVAAAKCFVAIKAKPSVHYIFRHRSHSRKRRNTGKSRGMRTRSS